MQQLLRTGACLVILAMASQAATLVFTGNLTGPNENPPVPSPGTGTTVVTYDSVAHTLNVDVTFSGLVGTTTVAHIHCCVTPPGTVGVATFPGTFPGFPAGVTAGSYNGTIDLTMLTSYTSGFLTNFTDGTAADAEATLIGNMVAGRSYLNVHSSFAGSGEIRDFLTLVPEPGTYALLGGALAFLSVYRLRKKSA